MESSNQKPDQVFCSVRRQWVAALPEEIVRQNLLKHLINQLGFPASLIVVEMSLQQMPHLNLGQGHIPERRADVVCFAKGIHPVHDLYPLLLIECKAVKLSAKVINQVTGYNHFLKACFIAAVSQEKVQMGWFDRSKQTYVFANHIPSYQQLISSVSK